MQRSKWREGGEGECKGEEWSGFWDGRGEVEALGVVRDKSSVEDQVAMTQLGCAEVREGG